MLQNIPQPLNSSSYHSNNINTVVSERTRNQIISSLENYYKLLFPHKMLINFYTFCNQENFAHRKFVFNYNTAYVYNLFFANETQFKIETVARAPLQIMVGAQMEDCIDAFRPSGFVKTRELIFDIDATDYSDVRECCAYEKKCCPKCWEYIKIVYTLVDSELRETFNFKHILWVYSGRRGVHCYVFDKSALDQRDIISSLELTQKINDSYELKNDIDFKSGYIKKALKLFNTHFMRVCVREQKIFATNRGIDMLINSSPIVGVRSELSIKLTPYKNNNQYTSEQIYEEYESFLKTKGGQHLNQSKIFLMLKIFSPRFDSNVTTDDAHLLKCPFSVNSNTFNIVTPFDITQNFNPIANAVNLQKLLIEYKRYNGDVEKTSLFAALKIFDIFNTNLQDEYKSTLDCVCVLFLLRCLLKYFFFFIYIYRSIKMDKHTNKWTKDFKTRQESYELYVANVNSYLEYLIKSTITDPTHDDKGDQHNTNNRPHYQYFTPIEIDRPHKRTHQETNNKIPHIDPFVFKRPKTPS